MGAGGSDGGVVRFFLGLAMFIAGTYLLLDSITVMNPMRMGHGMFNVGGFRITSGYLLIPFIFGVGLVFANSESYLGWFLVGASIIMLIIGVITSIQFSLHGLSAFSILMILILMFGGLGLFISSMVQHRKTIW